MSLFYCKINANFDACNTDGTLLTNEANYTQVGIKKNIPVKMRSENGKDSPLCGWLLRKVFAQHKTAKNLGISSSAVHKVTYTVQRIDCNVYMLKTNTELQISLFSFKCRHNYSGNDYTGLGTHPKTSVNKHYS